MKKLLTVRDTAQRLSLSEGKVYRMAWLQELPAVYIGRSLRIPEAAVNEIIDPGTRNIPTDPESGSK